MKAGQPVRATVVVTLLLLSCAGADSRPWNVVLVMVDTLRADRMGLYNGSASTTPNITSLAKDAVVFERASSDAGCTFPSVNSVLTSRWPHRQMARIDEVGMTIPEDHTTLAQVLRSVGYQTAAVSSSLIVRATPSSINQQGGFDAGFDQFDETCLEKRAPCVNAQAQEQLDTLREPFFLYLHYLEPHEPYRPPAWFASDLEPPPGVPRWVARGEPRRIAERIYGPGSLEDLARFGPAELEHLRALYDEEIRFFDHWFQRLIEGLRQRNILDRTLLVLMSDHGEELLEHGEIGHCRDLAYDTVTRVPLLMWFPGHRFSGRRSSLVQNLDVMPTILDTIGIEHEFEFDGISLLSVLERDRPSRTYTSSMQGVSRTLVVDDWKLIHNLATQQSLLFDLSIDPGETQDLASAEPVRVRRLEQILKRLLTTIDGPGARQQAEAIRTELERLGYL